MTTRAEDSSGTKSNPTTRRSRSSSRSKTTKSASSRSAITADKNLAPMADTTAGVYVCYERQCHPCAGASVSLATTRALAKLCSNPSRSNPSRYLSQQQCLSGCSPPRHRTAATGMMAWQTKLSNAVWQTEQAHREARQYRITFDQEYYLGKLLLNGDDELTERFVCERNVCTSCLDNDRRRLLAAPAQEMVATAVATTTTIRENVNVIANVDVIRAKDLNPYCRADLGHRQFYLEASCQKECSQPVTSPSPAQASPYVCYKTNCISCDSNDRRRLRLLSACNVVRDRSMSAGSVVHDTSKAPHACVYSLLLLISPHLFRTGWELTTRALLLLAPPRTSSPRTISVARAASRRPLRRRRCLRLRLHRSSTLATSRTVSRARMTTAAG